MNVNSIIYNAGQLLTCAAQGAAKKGAQMRDVGIVTNGAVAVKNGLIAAVGDSETILREFSAAEMFDAGGKVVCPAFVDPHTHVVFAGNRLNEFELKIKGADYLEILANGGGIISTVRQTRAATIETLVAESCRRLDKMLAHGTTTAEIKTGYGLNSETELKMLVAIDELNKTHQIELIPTFLPAHAIPPEFKGSEDEYVRLICEEMLPDAFNWYRSSGIYRGAANDSTGKLHEIIDSADFSCEAVTPFFVDVFCEKNAFTLEQSRRVLQTAKSLGFKLKAHVDEFSNLGAARMAIELGAASIDHLDHTSDAEIRLLADSNTIGIVTPTVNFNFGATEFADARRMIDAGCAIAVSTDYNPGSAPCPSQPMAMAIACRYQKLLPSEAFNAATINAAFGLARGANVGSLETGKQADILILDTKDYREAAYEFGGNWVEKVFKRGKLF